MYIHRIVKNKVHRKFDPKRFQQDEEIKRWYADGGDDRFRYDYPLTKDSVVIDAGAYHGEWSGRIYDKYQCKVYAFEPVEKFFKITTKNLAGKKKVKVYQEGLGGKVRNEKIYLDEVSTSTFKRSSKIENVKIQDVKKFWQDNKLKKVDLIKINIEGGEYELLERLIDTELIKKIDYVQVQFHDVIPDFEKKMISLQRKLSKTHRPTYQYWLIWDNWKRKGL